MKTYAGIGSRATPPDVLLRMTVLASRLRDTGHWLRSGGARGADTAFADGALTECTIFRPEDATPAALTLASQFHPSWSRLSEYVQRLMGRNAMIVLGKDLDSPVDVVYCWTPGGLPVGGTGHSLRIAIAHDIRVVNLYDDQGSLDL